MITLDCEQGSEAWHKARLGIPTASEFNRIISHTLKRNSGAHKYMSELLAEQISGEAKTFRETKAIINGKDKEPIARARYELLTGYNVEEVGGVFLDENKNVMASPDGIIRELKKGIEIKCPNLDTHINYCLEGVVPDEYKMQVYGNLWVTGYETWDFISFHPSWVLQPLFIITVKRDEKLIEIMDKEIRAFSKTLEAYKKEMVAA